MNDRQNIDLNKWYKVADIRPLLGMGAGKVRALLKDKQAELNRGRLLPNVAKTGTGWQIVGAGLVMLLDMLKAGSPAEQEQKIMAKKSFTTKDNPALKFLDNDNTQEPAEAKQGEDMQAEQEQAQPVASVVLDDKQGEEPAEEQEQKAVNPLSFIKPKKQKKTARLQLVLPPALLEEVKAFAKSNGLSVNDFACQLFESVLRK